ncbi:hypothetical protein M2322_004865 [Rhodoblastus acidophilus]|uniref:hypothetical protein n=1 Tax=Rhodoblastus acidophilus TaxID=1074 RepID=UPI00222474D4|nr:hypothetical protein [Rhodoblastus acidophilus]MCW2319296.1 hypothetical protein [Rhodoblastus acidophilus]
MRAILAATPAAVLLSAIGVTLVAEKASLKQRQAEPASDGSTRFTNQMSVETSRVAWFS